METNDIPAHPRHDEIVAAIRNDRLVGRGTCSVIDECYTDDELVEAFGYDRPFASTDTTRPRTPAKARTVARRVHRLDVAVYNDIAGA
jgi:hypothetical protein